MDVLTVIWFSESPFSGSEHKARLDQTSEFNNSVKSFAAKQMVIIDRERKEGIKLYYVIRYNTFQYNVNDNDNDFKIKILQWIHEYTTITERCGEVWRRLAWMGLGVNQQ